jgi:hypothetical protein
MAFMFERLFYGALLLTMTSGFPAWSQSTSLSRAGTLSHIAAGGYWDTTIWLINTSAAPVSVELDLHADDGSALSLPLEVAQQGATQSVTAAKLSRIIGSSTALMVETGQLNNIVTGWADVLSSGPVSGFAIFRTKCPACTASEGTVSLQGESQSTLIVPYDNTGGFITGVALANLSATQANITTTIWDEYGSRFGAATMTIPASGHTSFVAGSVLPATVANRGIIQFQNSSGGALDGLGLRFSPYGTFTSVPTIPQASLFQITSLNPASGQAGNTVTLVIGGTNLSGVTDVQFSPPAGISVSNVRATATQVTATVAIAANAAAGQVNVSASSPAGTSNSLPFTIQAANVPQIASLSPTTGQAGSTVSLSISGSSLSGVTAVLVSPSTGITVSNVRATATQVTATLAIGASVAAGQVNVSVWSPAGSSNSLPLTISPTITFPYEGRWTGTTSQNQPISLTIANNNVTAYSYAITFPSSLSANCPTGATVTSGPATSIPIISGSFSTSTLSGWFQSATAATGSLNWTLSLPGCGANGVVSWTAAKH